MRMIVVGMGVQGEKRQAVAADQVVATVDSVPGKADHADIREVELDRFDAALVCTPDQAKLDILEYLLGNGKHVLVEKPLIDSGPDRLERLRTLARDNGAVCYTAYNHRFEPHFIRMRDLIAGGELGRIYSVRMFYGNGTARLVRDSAWRDQGAGVLPDLGSHLLDTLRFWLGEDFDPGLEVRGAFCHENRSFDHVILGGGTAPAVQLEMTMLSWRNHFTADVFAEHGSAHIESLCKWGPSTFTRRTRVLPSGRPPEESVQLVQSDPTWAAEHAHFVALCAGGGEGNLEADLWLNSELHRLAAEAGVASFDAAGPAA